MVLVAVSGGIDSMCLLEKVRLAEDGPFAAAHCNFQLRGQESDQDEALVRDYCSKYGILLHVKAFDTKAYSTEKGISIEMAARELRYRWFGQLASEHGYEAVLVAHNAQDNAETLILNLLRGTGPKGIIGMKEDGFLPDPEYSHIPLRRPLLGMTREEIADFAREHSLPWREDSTNLENGYKRNKIRNQVFPVFREINPSFIRTLNRDMERFSEAWGEERFCEAHELDRSGGTKTFSQKKCRKSFVPASTEFIVVEEEWTAGNNVQQEPGHLIMDACKIGAVPVFSFWQEGDWIRPLGAPGKKKLQDWFTDHHVPVDLKHMIPLVRDPKEPSHILAIAGYCIDKKVKVGPATKKIYRIDPI